MLFKPVIKAIYNFIYRILNFIFIKFRCKKRLWNYFTNDGYIKYTNDVYISSFDKYMQIVFKSVIKASK